MQCRCSFPTLAVGLGNLIKMSILSSPAGQRVSLQCPSPRCAPKLGHRERASSVEGEAMVRVGMIEVNNLYIHTSIVQMYIYTHVSASC